MLYSFLIDTFLPMALTLIFPLITWGLAELAHFIRSKTKSDKVNGAFSILSELIGTTVGSLEQTLKDEMKARSPNNRLTKNDIVELKVTAVERVKELLPDKTAKLCRYGVKSLTAFIENKIEHAVNESKK